MFLNALNTQMLVAAEKQRQVLILFGGTLATCLISAAILIPIYGPVGAACGILLSELCLLISASIVARGYFRPVASVETALGRD
jgi:O-antigen/teichoic acid export membrane protein